MMKYPGTAKIDSQKAHGLGRLIDDLTSAAKQAGLASAPVLSYDAAGLSTGYDRIALVVDAPNGVRLRLSGSNRMLQGDNQAASAAEFLRRWNEALDKADSLADALHSARARVEAALEEAGSGIRLVSIAIGDLDVDDRITVRGLTFRVEIEHLDHLLVPRIHELDDAPVSEIIRKLRSAGKIQARRAKQKARLVRMEALFDLDTLSRAAIAASGLSVAAIAAELLNVGIVWLPRFDGGHRLTVVLDEGVTRLVGEITAGPDDQLAVDGDVFKVHRPQDAEALEALVGQSLRTFINSPVTRAAGPVKRVARDDASLITVMPRSISHRPIRIA